MLREIIREEIPGTQDFSASIFDLPIDSFGMVVLRGRIEAALGRPVSDNVWGRIETLNDILALSSKESISSSVGASSQMRRSYSVNMPQMAMGGLSELWLLKELGDLHWGMIASGRRSQSSSRKTEAAIG